MNRYAVASQVGDNPIDLELVDAENEVNALITHLVRLRYIAEDTTADCSLEELELKVAREHALVTAVVKV